MCNEGNLKDDIGFSPANVYPSCDKNCDPSTPYLLHSIEFYNYERRLDLPKVRGEY